MMTLLKTHRLHINLIVSIGFTLLLLLFRIKITHSFFYVFLVWNLFLAGIPYLITQSYMLLRRWRFSKTMGFAVFLIWLLFLPNSPYIITDLVHLHDTKSSLMWFDLFLVFVFAFNGLLLGLLSLKDMFKLIAARYTPRVAKYTIFQVCLLSGYGIYLGRFLRFNSWDVITKPKTLALDMINSMYEPKVWFMTFAFGGFLWILFSLVASTKEMRLKNS